MRRSIWGVLLGVAVMCGILACSGPGKLRRMKATQMRASIGLAEDDAKEPVERKPDTLVVRDDEEQEMILMRAIQDENGEMVATDVIEAAVVEARFRHVAERQGMVDIAFLIRVPAEMWDEGWQLRFYPEMRVMEDVVALEPVIVTGARYRREQLRGYQRYERFLAGIVSDSTRLIHMRQLELFIRRNIPDLYAFKADTAVVEAVAFERVLDRKVASAYASRYGVTGREAIEHYTRRAVMRRNDWRRERQELMFRRYVKAPIVREGVRLDTVLAAGSGDFAYEYVQTLRTRPGLRKVDVVLAGEVFEQDRRVYEIPMTEPLTYYISSLSAFVDDTPRYMKKIINRRAEANTACYVDFEKGSAEIVEALGHNREEMGRIKGNLASLLENREYDLDSIVVTANCSPEGSLASNVRLSQRRSEAVSRYFGRYIAACRDSLAAEAERVYYFEDGKEIPGRAGDDRLGAEDDRKGVGDDSVEVKFISRSNPENWRALEVLVAESDSLTAEQKSELGELCRIDDLDAREAVLASRPYYRFLREILYPRLRTVKFDFYLHRKDMVQDTLVTTVPDEVYMDGVQAIRNRDYERAIVILRPYRDFNAAVAFCAMGYNASALEILEALPCSDRVDYLLAVVYSRMGREREAVERYLSACRRNPSLVHRGKLDPEISRLIKQYTLSGYE